ncbi:MAG TPA: type I 3-dehydroquinate dehydratase [Bacteroidales bacterium]
MICVSLAGISFQECVKWIAKTEFAEVRIDQLDLSDDQFGSLFAMKKKTIATCRPGKDDDQRLALLKLAIESGAGYVDIEYESDPTFRNELLNYAHSHQTIAIISYHNFDLTPSAKELNDIIEQSFNWGADRVKLATTPQSLADCARMMSLYEKHDNLIAFCMGKIGTITRVAAPLLGAEFTYAAINKTLATAPGQLTVDGFMDVYDVIK